MEGVPVMIDRCFNPECGRELRYLRDGRVVRVIHGKGEDASVEHFWLCGRCYETHDFAFPPTGKVSIEQKSRKHAERVYINDIQLER